MEITPAIKGTTKPTPMAYNYKPPTTKDQGKYFPSLTMQEEKNLQSFLKNKYPDAHPQERYKKAQEYVKKKEEKTQERGTYQVGKTIENLVPSAMNYGKNMRSAVTNPMDTVKGLGKLAVGATEAGIDAIGNKIIPGYTDIETDTESLAKNVMIEIVKPYTSKEEFFDKLENDPITIISDILSVIGGGAGIASKALGTQSKLGNIASKVEKVANMTNPANIIPAVPAKAASKLGDFFQGTMKRVSQDIPESLIGSALKIKPSDKMRISKPNVAGMSPEEWLLKEGISGSDDAIKTSLGTVISASKSGVDDGLKGLSGRFKNEATKNILEDLKGIYKDVKGNEKKYNEILSLSKLHDADGIPLTSHNRVKRLLDSSEQIYKNTGDPKLGARYEGLLNLRDELKTFIEDTAAKNGVTNIKELNKKTQVAKEILDAMDSRALTKGNNNLISLTDWLGGGTVASATSMLGASSAEAFIASASFVMFKKFMEKTSTKTTIAKWLNKLPNGGQKGAIERVLKKIDNATPSTNLNQSEKAIINNILEKVSGLITNEDMEENASD